MKSLVAPTLIILFSWSLMAQVDEGYKVLSGFQKNDNTYKSTSPNLLLSKLKFSPKHKLQAISDGVGRYQQYYDGIPIKNGILVYNPFGYGGNLYRFDTIQGCFELSADQILIRLALTYGDAIRANQNIRKILIPDNGVIYPAYEIVIHEIDMFHSRIVYVSASDGSQIAEEPLSIPFGQAVLAQSLYDETVSVAVYQDSTNYSLSHDILNHRTFDLNTSVNKDSINEITGDNSILLDHHDGIQAHYAMGVTLDYFALRHGRESYDDQSSDIQAFINYGDHSNIAFWSHGNIVLGSGDGVHYGDLSAIDIVGHEFSHGVIDRTADLHYSGEPGALNESFADIFGEMTELFAKGKCNWEAGSQVALSKRVRFRNFANPKGMNLPDTYMGDYWINTDCGSPNGINDYCGVHSNSSVQNKWFYLLSNGGQGRNDHGDGYEVIGISADDAAAIAYKNLTQYLWSTSGYYEAREGAILAAEELYGKGSVQVISTTNAWYAVGVGEAHIDEPIVQEDTLAHMVITVDQITAYALSVSWEKLPNQSDSIYYTIDLGNAHYTSQRDTTLTIVGLYPDSSYHLSVKTYEGDRIIGMSDTMAVLTLPSIVNNDTIQAYYFELGLAGWEVSHDDAQWYRGKRSPEGLGSIRLRDDITNNRATSPWINVDAHQSINLSCTLYAWSIEYGEQLHIAYRHPDKQWQDIAKLKGRHDFHNYLNQRFTFEQLLMTEDSVQFRIGLDASANSDHIYFDEFIISTSRERPTFQHQNKLDIDIWPNPTAAYIQIKDGSGMSQIRIYDSKGLTVYKASNKQTIHRINTSSLQAGVYIVEFIGASLPIVRTFVID